MSTPARLWQWVYRGLWGCFLLAAALNMLSVRGGFLTNYLADLAVPALLYVLARKPAACGIASPWLLMRWLGAYPERAALGLFLASAATEASQIFWPHGLFSGRFDPWDVAAYGAGIAACYVLDKREYNAGSRQAQVES
jgi:hypothetical protein